VSEPNSYDLLCKPWIPVVWRHNTLPPTEPKIGIREALERAHDIKCISHTAPFIEFGLYRLLITVVLDAHIVAERRPTIGKMKQSLGTGQFDTKIVGDYLNDHKGRFDLWADQRPFLQMPNAGGQDAIAKMIAPVPSGTKIAYWHHFGEGETRLSEEEAARELCAVVPFCFDYAPKDICTVGGDPPLYVLVQGDSLFETIIYNLPKPSGRLTCRQDKEGGPSWRCQVSRASELPRSPTHAQAWTWPVRQVRLQAKDTNGCIAKAANTAGAGKTAARERIRGWRDPNAGTITDTRGIRHIRATDLVPSYARNGGQGDQNPMVFWRDLVPMCLVSSEGEGLKGERLRSRPEVITNALRVAQTDSLRIDVYGFIDKGGRNNKVFRTWFRSVFTLPTEIARDSRLSSQILDAFKTAQNVADWLQTAMRLLRPKMDALPRERKKLKETRRTEGDTLAGFWQALEPILARSYLDDLPKQSADAKENLNVRLKQVAREAFQRMAASHRRTADGLFRIANANNWLERRLYRLFPKERQQ
jgi:CRISPR type I-E-associated protein CasA/Cse1